MSYVILVAISFWCISESKAHAKTGNSQRTTKSDREQVNREQAKSRVKPAPAKPPAEKPASSTTDQPEQRNTQPEPFEDRVIKKSLSGETLSQTRAHHLFSLKLGFVNYEYSEPNVTLEGQLTEVAAEVRYRLVSIPLWGAVQADWIFGKTEYKGQFLDAATNTSVAVTRESAEEIRVYQGILGISLLDFHDHLVDLYSGYGLWTLKNKIEGDGSYTRNTTNTYIPVGLDYTYRASQMWTFALGAQYNWLLTGQTETKFSDLGANSDDTTFHHDTGDGWRFHTEVELNLERINPYMELYFWKWSVEASKVERIRLLGTMRNYYEPATESQLIGLNLGIRF